MFCSNCGTKVTDGAKFCTNCGQKLTSVQVKEEKSRGGLTLRIVRAKQWYAVNPPIQITVDGQQNYSVENGMYIDIPILAGRHHILFFLCDAKESDGCQYHTKYSAICEIQQNDRWDTGRKLYGIVTAGCTFK